jgi:ABC-type lipoprotein export system ATPase subunit
MASTSRSGTSSPLPAERPDEVAMLLRGLAERRVALAVGPSGAGKSALLWMAAYLTRYDVRWYRIARLA